MEPMTLGRALVVLGIIAFTALGPSVVVMYWMFEEDRPLKQIEKTSKRVFWAGAVVGLFMVALFYRMS